MRQRFMAIGLMVLVAAQAEAGLACFDKTSGKWLGTYVSGCTPTLTDCDHYCDRYWTPRGVTVEQRVMTDAEAAEAVSLANAPIAAANATKRANARANTKTKLGLNDQQLQDLKDALQ